jgi:hypothetical protein
MSSSLGGLVNGEAHRRGHWGNSNKTSTRPVRQLSRFRMWPQTNWGTVVGTADYRHPNVSQPPVGESQAACGGVRDIDQAAPYIRAPVRHSKNHRTAVLEICDLHFGTQRQSAMRRRHFAVVERCAARGKVPPETRSVPARETVLDASSL